MLRQMTLPVFFDARMVGSRQCSPSATKPGFVVCDWLRQGLPIELRPVVPATPEQIMLAHKPKFVRGVLSCEKHNGFGSRDARVAASLPFTTGSMMSAARHVLEHGGVAASPTSGFHHAHWDHGGGFCTFNGLLVTALAMRAEGRAQKIAIIDCDQHFGDGTEGIIRALKLRGIQHFTAGGSFHRAHQVKEFFRVLRQVCERANECDLVLFQAGADPHIKDPLGGWLTTAQLRERDEIVFSTVTKPLVWNLAGGYQEEPDGSIPKVLEVHANTVRAWVAARDGVLSPSTVPSDEEIAAMVAAEQEAEQAMRERGQVFDWGQVLRAMQRDEGDEQIEAWPAEERPDDIWRDDRLDESQFDPDSDWCDHSQKHWYADRESGTLHCSGCHEDVTELAKEFEPVRAARAARVARAKSARRARKGASDANRNR